MGGEKKRPGDATPPQVFADSNIAPQPESTQKFASTIVLWCSLPFWERCAGPWSVLRSRAAIGPPCAEKPQSTVVVTVEVLFFVFGSDVAEVTVAVSVIVFPEVALTFTTRVIFREFPLPSVPTVHVTVPVPPTGGAVHVPVFGVTLTKVVPVGVASLTLTDNAVSGPLFLAAIL